MELHVWGYDNEISVIEPECLASAWLLQSLDISFKIVTSNNTNISPTHSLPLLIDEEQKIAGYSSIFKFVSKKQEKKKNNLIEFALISYITENFKPLNQYNLYIKSDNYEKYTRKLFKNYFPFPMMYNQPLKFYYGAQELVSTVGLKSEGQGFFNFNGSGANVAETEMVNESTTDDVAISSLHEKQLISKSKQRKNLTEARYTLKCLTLMEEHMNHILKVYSSESGGTRKEEPEVQEEQEEQEENAKNEEKDESKENTNISVNLSDNFGIGKFIASDMLLFAYIYSLTFKELPSTFILNFMRTKFSSFTSEALKHITQLNENLGDTLYKKPESSEIPNLWNELVYVTKQFV
ncbi:sorting assembly machinery 37 kDa subunit [[Candida] railenensis]|uniref:Sorting assembly machinery 37 kDa subunit n=1 Tax=[Candida] railenensis TaxID=45579 RepID=A0A9P0QPI8_9ASCO|nr:sorting assembly machinery 37 kDa subunit [[Candida] railenensis]